MIVVALWIFSNPSLYLGALAVGTVTTLVFGLLENATLARSGHRPIMVVYRLRYSSQFSVGIFLIWFLLTPYYLWLRQRQIPSTRPLFLATLTLSLLTVAAACAWYMTHPPFPSS
jgi:cytochrome bd-type quinol oxidase subunit 1